MPAPIALFHARCHHGDRNPERLGRSIAAALLDPGALIAEECLAAPAVPLPEARAIQLGHDFVLTRPGDAPLPAWLGQLVHARNGRVRVDDAVELPITAAVLAYIPWAHSQQAREARRSRLMAFSLAVSDAEIGLRRRFAPAHTFGGGVSVVLSTDQPIEDLVRCVAIATEQGARSAIDLVQVPQGDAPLANWRAAGWTEAP